jgi:hypothetical protein
MTDLAALSRHPDLPRRAGITLAALAVYWVGCWIPLPGIDITPLIGPTPTHNTAVTRLSTMALGMTPVLSAFMLLEMLMIAFPSFRRWTTEPARREALNTWATVVALLIAALQATGIANALEQLPGLVPNPGPIFLAGVIVTLVGATALLTWLSSLITRYGIGHGFWLLVALPYAGSFVETMVTQARLWGPASLLSIAVSIGFLGLSIAVLAWLVKTSPPLATVEELPWAPILGFTAAGWLLLVPVFILSMLGASGPELDAVYGGPALMLLPIITVPLLLILRRRSFDTTSSLAAPLALAALVAIGTALAYLPSQPLFPNPAIVLTLAATGLLVALGISQRFRSAAAEPLP